MQKSIDASDIFIRISYGLLGIANLIVFLALGATVGTITSLITVGIMSFIAGMSAMIIDKLKKNADRP